MPTFLVFWVSIFYFNKSIITKKNGLPRSCYTKAFSFFRYVIITRINNNRGVVTQIPSKPQLSSTNQGKNGIPEENINKLSTKKIIVRIIILILMFLWFMVLILRKSLFLDCMIGVYLCVNHFIPICMSKFKKLLAKSPDVFVWEAMKGFCNIYERLLRVI